MVRKIRSSIILRSLNTRTPSAPASSDGIPGTRKRKAQFGPDPSEASTSKLATAVQAEDTAPEFVAKKAKTDEAQVVEPSNQGRTTKSTKSVKDKPKARVAESPAPSQYSLRTRSTLAKGK